MAFKRLKLINYKRFEYADIDLAPNITLLLGPNSSGKSSIIKSILSLKQTINSNNEHEVLATQGDYVDLGVYKDFVFSHDTRKNITIGVGFAVDEKVGLIELLGLSKQLLVEFTYDYDPISEQARIYQLDVSSSDNKKIFSLCRKKTRNSYTLKLDENIIPQVLDKLNVTDRVTAEQGWNKGLTVYHHEKLRFSTSERNVKKLKEGPLFSINALPFHFFENVLNVFTNSVQDDIYYLGPLRKSPARSYTKTSHNRNVGPTGEHTASIFSDLERRTKKVTRGRSDIKESYEALIYGMQTIFPNKAIETKTFEELVKVIVTSTKAGLPDNNLSTIDVLSDVGFGFSQIFPILVQASVMPIGSTLIIEQPELHLHPMAQASFAKVIARFANSGKRFIIETHSEHFLRGLQLEVSERNLNSEKGLSNNDLNILYVPEFPDQVIKMNINVWGEITSEWPTGFFDEAYKLAFALMQNKSKSLNNNGETL